MQQQELKTASCAGCHGQDGNSAIASFPKLAGLGEKYLTAQLRHVKAGERVIVEMTGLLDYMTAKICGIWRPITTAKKSRFLALKKLLCWAWTIHKTCLI